VTPYYEDEQATIFHADCRDVLPTLSDVSLVVTSPPYNLGTSSGGGFGSGSLAAADMTGGYDASADALLASEYDEWQTDVVSSLWSVLADDGAIFYNHKPRIQNGVAKLPTDYGVGLPLRQVIIWDRGTGLNFSPTFFLPKCEWIVVWAKPAWTLRDRSVSQLGDVWRFPPESSDAHPAAFPLGLPARVIDSTNPGLVLDPFMGSGTTLRAAKDAGRSAIGCDTSERYCEIAATRLAQGVLEFGPTAAPV
jgi:DNA modification methylase